MNGVPSGYTSCRRPLMPANILEPQPSGGNRENSQNLVPLLAGEFSYLWSRRRNLCIKGNVGFDIDYSAIVIIPSLSCSVLYVHYFKLCCLFILTIISLLLYMCCSRS